MTDQERLQAITDRLDMILERVPDNPIYEDHEARAIEAYLRAIKTMREEVFECKSQKGGFLPPSKP